MTSSLTFQQSSLPSFASSDFYPLDHSYQHKNYCYFSHIKKKKKWIPSFALTSSPKYSPLFPSIANHLKIVAPYYFYNQFLFSFSNQFQLYFHLPLPSLWKLSQDYLHVTKSDGQFSVLRPIRIIFHSFLLETFCFNWLVRNQYLQVFSSFPSHSQFLQSLKRDFSKVSPFLW